MTTRRDLPAVTREARSLALVVLGYRCAMAQLCGAQVRQQTEAWEALQAAAPASEAEALFGCVFGFARALVTVAERPLEWRRTRCAQLCRDERLAVAMIDAAQRGDVSGLLGAAAELVGVENLGDALNATQTLATALSRRGLRLRPQRQAARCDLCPRRTLH